MLKIVNNARQFLFLLSPASSLPAGFSQNEAPAAQPSRLISITLAKSGTHLLYRALAELGLYPAYAVPYPYQQGIQRVKGAVEKSPLLPLYNEVREQMTALQPGGEKFIQAHLPYNELHAKMLSDLGYKKIVMLRDPRAVAVSFMFHVLKTEHPLRPYLASLPDEEARLMAVIEGVTPAQSGKQVFLNDMETNFRLISNWLKIPGALEIRFEDLIGPKGKGEQAVQFATFAKLSRFLGFDFTGEQLTEKANQIFDPTSATFRSGQIDTWRKHFKPRHVEAVKERANRVLVEFGYESGPDWSLYHSKSLN